MEINNKFEETKVLYEQKVKEFEIAQQELHMAKATLNVAIKNLQSKLEKVEPALKMKYGIKDLVINDDMSLDELLELESKLKVCFDELNTKLQKFLLTNVLDEDNSNLAPLTDTQLTKPVDGLNESPLNADTMDEPRGDNLYAR